MKMGTVFYLSSKKNEVLLCRNLAAEKISNRKDFEEIFTEDFEDVDIFKSLSGRFEPELLKSNEYFNVEKVDGVFEMTLKDGAIERALNIYVNTLEDYAEHIKKYKTRGFAINYGLENNSSLIRFNEVYKYNGDVRFMILDIYKEDIFKGGPDYVIEPEYALNIYQLIDLAINQGITKWYIMPVVGCCS